MLTKNRKKILLSVAILSIAMIVANILQTRSTISFIPLNVDNFSPNNSNDVFTQNNIGLDNLKEDSTSFSDDKISESQYDLSSMKIREDNKVEFVVKKDSLELIPEMNQLFKEYDVEIHKELTSINSIIVYIPLDSIESFVLDAKSAPGIAYAEPNFYDKICFIPDDEYYESEQWDLPLIGMESAWDYELGSHDILVAVIDSGIDYNHLDLHENYVNLGYDWVNNDIDPMDDNGHGTHCAGTIAATFNNSIGIAGMTNVSIFAEKVFNAFGKGSHADFKAGVIHAVDMGADIISYSGSGAHSPTKREAIDYAIDNGVMVIAAAGNDDTSYPAYPAAYSEVIAVAATNQSDQRAYFPGWWGSNYGDWIDVSAPGVNIYSTIPGNSYASWSGTSMACPHVAGLAALLMSEYPTFTPTMIEYLIKNNAVDLGEDGFDIYYGWGRIDAGNIFNNIESPIHIDDNAGNNWEWAKNYYWCSGSGTPNDPYVIKNLIIDAGGSGSCILIENSNAYFKIENCMVTNSGSDLNDAGIKLLNTNNGEIIDNDCTSNKYGICLKYSDSNTISGNTVIKNYHGINLDYSNDNNVLGNTVNDNYYGIYLYKSHRNTISGNIANNNDQIGIQLSFGDSSTISGNTANDNSYSGIYLFSGDSSTISGNTVCNSMTLNQYIGIYLSSVDSSTISGNIANDNTKYGIYLEDNCDDNTISGNIIKNNRINGIFIEGATSQNNLIYQNSFIGTGRWHARDTGTNNHWNSSGIGNYWDNHTSPDSDNDGIVDNPYTWITGSVDSEDSFPLVEIPVHLGEKIHIDDSGISAWKWNKMAKLKFWCTGSGIYSDPYVIQDLIIDGGGSASCILIENSNAYFKIENCMVINSGSDLNDAGIKVLNTNNGEIINNECSSNKYGICLKYSDSNTISGNTVIENYHGINLDYSNDNNVLGNTVNDNYYGIYLFSCISCTISGNTANNNDQTGIQLSLGGSNTISGNTANDNGYSGINLASGDSCTISGNTVCNSMTLNQNIGINLYSSDSSIISGNTANDNTNNGIYLNENCDDNLIYLNYLVGNGENAEDYGNNNQWDNGSTGNYWDDYNGVDANDDNIGDTPYNKNGVVDNYPIYRYHESPIYIDDSAENNWEWARNQIWCNGSGTLNDPYVIKDLIIDGGGSATGSCITIKNSNAYFRIENCKVYNSGFGGNDAGIRLINTNNGIIFNNDVSQNVYGIWLKNSNENILYYNILVENYVGIILQDSSRNIIIGNTFINHLVGILIVGSSSNNPILYNAFYGILFRILYFITF